MQYAFFTFEWWEKDENVIDFRFFSGWFDDNWGAKSSTVSGEVCRMPKIEWLEFREALESNKKFHFVELVKYPCGHYRHKLVVGKCAECHFDAYFKRSKEKPPRGGFF